MCAEILIFKRTTVERVVQIISPLNHYFTQPSGLVLRLKFHHALGITYNYRENFFSAHTTNPFFLKTALWSTITPLLK